MFIVCEYCGQGGLEKEHKKRDCVAHLRRQLDKLSSRVDDMDNDDEADELREEFHKALEKSPDVAREIATNPYFVRRLEEKIRVIAPDAMLASASFVDKEFLRLLEAFVDDRIRAFAEPPKLAVVPELERPADAPPVLLDPSAP